MPNYTYKAKSQPNKIIQGEIEADSQQDAIDKLVANHLFPISVNPESSSLEGRRITGFGKVSNKEIVFFTRQLSSLIGSGVNIINALNIVTNQSSSKSLKIILRDIIDKIKNGDSLSKSLQSYGMIFSPLYSAMVHIGESSGKLEDTFEKLAEFLENEQEFRDSLRASLTYPFFVLGVGILTIVALFIFVIPRLVGMFADMGQVLPLPTRILISISGFICNYWWLIILIVFSSVFLFKRTQSFWQGNILLDKLKLKIVFFGKIILKTEISRFTRVLSLLFSSGVPASSAFEISASILDNQVLKQEVEKFKERITQGVNLSTCFKDSEFFPEFVIGITAVGEETGALDKSLLRIANEYEKDVAENMRTVMQMLEPVIILGVGLVVGFIVLAMLLPIFQINFIVQ